MKFEKILESLCIYDRRNPDCVSLEVEQLLELEEYIIEDEISPGKCYCDNCFHGKTELANQLLKVIALQKAMMP